MYKMDGPFRTPDFVKILIASLIFFTLWFFWLTDATRPIFESQYFIAYTVFIAGYASFIVWLILKDTGGTPSFRNPKIYVAFILAFFLSDLFMYPYLVGKDTQPELPTDAQISSDMFIYKMLPADMPQAVKYFITYPLTLSIGFTIIALLTKHKRQFVNVVGKAL